MCRRDFIKFLGATGAALTLPYLVTLGKAFGGDTNTTGIRQTKVPSDQLNMNSTTVSSSNLMQRVEDLLRKMTIEEKVMQLSAVYPMGLLGAKGPIRSQLEAQLGHGTFLVLA